VLVVRLGAIGDVVNALVFATALKQAHPEVEIGWVVHELAQPLVEGHPSIDRVHLWRRNGGWAALRRVVGEIRSERYELAVDLQRIFKSALVARLSGAKRVLGHDRARAKEASWVWTKEHIPAGDPAAHMVEQYLEFVRHLGVAHPQARHVLPPDGEAEAWAHELVSELGAAPIVMSLGATKPANRWEPERFGELAVLLRHELDAPVLLIGGPDDQEAGEHAAKVIDNEPGVRNLVGRTSLRQLVALSREASLFIGCDTGPMHIAAATGTPVVALFGPADPRRTGPWGNEHRVVRVPPPCAPCNLKVCNQPRHACMEDITVELVLEAARERLALA
jgi:lipopolysaccharide heptosyltransferase II